MNVLIAANYATPASGNFIGSMMDLGLEMKKNDSDLFFIFPKNNNTTRTGSWVDWLEDNGFKVFLLDQNMSNSNQLLFLKKIIDDCNIDVLHIHFGLFHHFAMHNRSELPVKIVIHEHMEYPVGCDHKKQTIHFMVRSLAYRVRKLGIVSVNKEVDKAHLFAKHWYVPNSLSLKRHVDESMPREQRREQLGFKKDDKVVLFLGWDVHRKGLDIAVKAVQKCREEDPTIKLAIVGIGEPPKKERTDYIKESTGISPDEPWIYYLASTEDMFSYHRAVDVYLSASRSEAFSYGLLEAISQDTPIVVSDIKGTYWSSQYSRSLFYPVEDFEACASTLTKALAEGKRIPSNIDEIIDEYSINKWVSKIMAVYTKL